MKNYYINSVRNEIFGRPLLFQVIPEHATGRGLYEQIHNRISHFYHRRMPSDGGEDTKGEDTTTADTDVDDKISLNDMELLTEEDGGGARSLSL